MYFVLIYISNDDYMFIFCFCLQVMMTTLFMFCSCLPAMMESAHSHSLPDISRSQSLSIKTESAAPASYMPGDRKKKGGFLSFLSKGKKFKVVSTRTHVLHEGPDGGVNFHYSVKICSILRLR
jgi:hypothetical protein